MGCHTWFNNRLSDIPNEHLNILKMKALSNINGQRILKCKDYDEWVKTISSWHIDSDVKKKFIDKNFWDKRRKHVLWAKSVLETADPNPEAVLSVIREFGGLIYEDSYDLSGMGWWDNFRVYGYPEGDFKSAKETIDFLKKYDQSMITYNGVEGYCDDIGDIINKFFKEYPNGYIEYG